MIINFNALEEQILPQFKNGTQEFLAKIQGDEHNKIIHGRLQKGSSIGLHTHETNSEIIYILSGTATVLFDGTTNTLTSGMCHYCPKGHAHSLMNQHDEDLIFFAVIPEQ